MDTIVREAPSIILFDITSKKLVFCDSIDLDVSGVPAKLRLRGIIYGGHGHFTCRLIEADGTMWFHDGITTGRRCVPEININALADRLVLHKCGEKTAVACVYAKE
ncbi:hypothetical protein DFH06DRAFT_1003421 [Mycena polygramma]|nr:hypothetical protein DFH06DRAFT_1003421 [Mycena polygramma]